MTYQEYNAIVASVQRKYLQEISTLRKALELACADITYIRQVPSDAYYIQKAKEESENG